MEITFEKSCKNKYQYKTKRLANEALLSLNIENHTKMKYKIGNRKNSGKLNIYHCEFCGYWHIGHITWKANERGLMK